MLLTAEHYLPISQLFGRDEAIEALSAKPGVTSVVGPPGVGKSALAATLSHQVAGVFVPLQDATSLEGVLAATLRALSQRSIDDSPNVSIEAVVTWAQRLSPPVFVLDNVEHLIELDGFGDFVLQVAKAVPSVVLTSRRRPGLRGERVYEVRPMERETAVRLLQDRVERVRPEALREEGAAEAVQALIQHADGFPLLLELLAAQTRLRTLSQIANRVGQDGTSFFQRVLDSSWSSLSEGARRALMLLARFRDGVDVEALAEANEVLPECGISEAHLIEARDHSLVRVARGRLSVYRCIQDDVVLRERASGLSLDNDSVFVRMLSGWSFSKCHAFWAQGQAALEHALAREEGNLSSALELALSFGDDLSDDAAKLFVALAVVRRHTKNRLAYHQMVQRYAKVAARASAHIDLVRLARERRDDALPRDARGLGKEVQEPAVGLQRCRETSVRVGPCGTTGVVRLRNTFGAWETQREGCL